MKFLDIVRHDCGARYDANETAAFSRELEYVHAEVIEAKYPELKWRNIVPVKTGAPLGATAHRWFEIDGFGSAKYLDNLATDDFPTADVQGTEQTGKIRSLGAKYMVTIEELRAAAMMKVHVETEKAKIAKRAVETLIDKTVFGTYNTTNGGFKGIAHNDSGTEFSTSVANWFTQSTAGGDPQEIIADIRGMLEAAFLDTKGAFASFDLFMPPEIGVLLDRPMFKTSTVGSDEITQYLNMSIGQYALATLPYLRSITKDCFRLAAAGASAKHRILAFPRDPEVLDVFLPLDFEQFAPQLSGMAFTTHCHAKFGGLRVKHPKAVRYCDLETS